MSGPQKGVQIEAPMPSKHLEPMPNASQHVHRDPLDPPPPGTNGVRELLAAEEVAQLLGMSLDWVYAQTRKGRIPHIRLGRSVRYRRQAIFDWLEKKEQHIV